MNQYDFRDGILLSKQDNSFHTLLVAAFRKADDKNLRRLKTAFPEEFENYQLRYNAPNSGLLAGEKWPSETED
jgi:hypothetical protein